MKSETVTTARRPDRSRDRPRDMSRSRSQSSGSRNRHDRPTGGASRSLITRPWLSTQARSPLRLTREEPSRRLQIHPPSQSQAPEVSIPGTSADECRASQALTADTQQRKYLSQDGRNSHRKPPGQRDGRSPDRPHYTSRSRPPSS
jgi:hypothetical protein